MEIVTGVMIPPDFGDLLGAGARSRASSRRSSPSARRCCSRRRSRRWASVGNGLSTEVWWTPIHPFTSSLTRQSAKALAEAYEAGDQKPWTQPIGFAHALFEVARRRVCAAKSSKAADVRDAVAAHLARPVVGPVKSGRPGPVQERQQDAAGASASGARARSSRYELTIVSNEAAAAKSHSRSAARSTAG